MSNLLSIRNVLPIAALALSIGACRCDPPDTGAIRPDVVSNPAALSFEACPSQDENGNAVEDVFADRQTITLSNQANIGAPLTLTLTGAGADRFTLVEPPEAIGALGEVEVTVDFLPSAQGDATATLEVEDGDPETEVVKVTLIGTGTNLPAQPTLQVSFETAPGTNEFSDCIEGVPCYATLPETRFGNSTTMRVKVRNLGCPALKVTGLDIALPEGSSAGANLAYFLDEPVLAPSPENPTLLTIADGTQEMEAVVRFEPSPEESGDSQRYAYFTIRTNDPRQDSTENEPGVRTVVLSGTAVQPNLYATPSYCDFTNPDDLCGGTKVTTGGNNKAAVFQITNGGATDVTIETVRVAGAHGDRFGFGQQNPQGMVIPAFQSAPLEVQYTDAPTYVIDFIEVIAADGLGDTTIRVSGGEQPKLNTDTEPTQELDFSSVTEPNGSLPVQICNEAGAGMLVINSLSITPVVNPPFFVLKSGPAPGTQVAAGSCVTAEIQFNKPVSGGLQAANFTIQSNDPRYSTGYVITLLSEAPLNQFPVAVLQSLAGQTNQFAISLQQTPLGRITLDGSDSYDPPNNDPVAEYQYFLLQKPPNATNAKLTEGTDPTEASIASVKGPHPDFSQPTLHLHPGVTGEYVIRLVVYDASGQSSSPTDLRILVNP